MSNWWEEFSHDRFLYFSLDWTIRVFNFHFCNLIRLSVQWWSIYSQTQPHSMYIATLYVYIHVHLWLIFIVKVEVVVVPQFCFFYHWVGYRCVLQCAKEGRPLPRQAAFTCCLTMEAVKILAYGFDADQMVLCGFLSMFATCFLKGFGGLSWFLKCIFYFF